MTLFDANGRYVSGQQGTVDLDYTDDKLAAARAAGARMTSEFDAAPGKYLVRVVLRDGEGHMSSTSRLVEAP